MTELLSPLGQAFAQTKRYRILDLARGRRDVISMGRGDPDLPTPEHIVEAGSKALSDWGTHYTAAEGHPRLREAIAAKLRRDNALTYSPQDVLVTSGGQEALFLAMMCLLGAGDAALITDPYYGAFQPMALAAGARLIPIPGRDGTMEPDVDALARAATPDVKVLVLVSPNNPSSNVTADTSLEALARLAHERNLTVISDEIYEKLVFDGHHHRSIAALPGMQERTVVTNGFAKTYCMTGWRIGYAAGPTALIGAMARLKQTISICAPAVSQAAALEALEGPQQCVDDLLSTYAERRGVVLRALDAAKLPYVPQQGTFYVYADIRRARLTSDAFAEGLLQREGVLVFPSTEFGRGPHHIRLSLLHRAPVLEEAVGRIARVWHKYLNGGD